jgi:hypothetical protein
MYEKLVYQSQGGFQPVIHLNETVHHAGSVKIQNLHIEIENLHVSY